MKANNLMIKISRFRSLFNKTVSYEIDREKYQATKLNKLYALFLNELYCDRLNENF